MDYYQYVEWVSWPTEDIREYAAEIADDQSLSLKQADYLERQMLLQSGYWPAPKLRIGPIMMGAETEALYRSLDKDDADVFAENRRLNTPYIAPRHRTVDKWEAVGSGLTRRWSRKIISESPDSRRERKRLRRSISAKPFMSMNMRIRNQADEAMWAAGCYPISSGNWLVTPNNDAPHEGLIWYSRELLRAYCNAREHGWKGNTEAAMWHAFRAGSLSAELDVRLAHGRNYEKFETVKAAQQDAARSRKTVPDEVRRDMYWRYRQEGNKRVESGRLAADQLGLSESSIRNAFPNRKYPPE